MELVNENDIFILTSLWEGLPISLLEAMYLKKICIVSDCIGNRDVIENNKNGFVAKDIKNFIQILNEIKDNKYDLENIIKQQLSDLIREYNVDVMAKKYKKEYK